ncbi:MAG: extracellular solute-binding protein [Clostridia bacterium]
MKISMKKKIACGLLAMMLLALSGCAQKTSHTDSAQKQGDTVTITIWHDKEEALVEALAQAFQSLEPAIHVNLLKKPGLTEALKMVGNDAKAAPDLYLFAHDKIGVYAEMGILAPITDFLSEEQLAGLLPMTRKAATYQDTMYQLPLYFETLLFMYNQKFMKPEDVPTTTEELYAYMQRKTKGGRYGFVEQHSTPYYSAAWIHAFGGSLIGEDRVPRLNTPETVRALAYHKKFVELMAGETEYAMVQTLFTEGKAHATIGGPWMVPTVRAAGMALGIAPMPIVPDTGKPLAPYSGVQGVHVLKVAAQEKKEAITKVLETLLSVELNAVLAKASGCAPALAACYELPKIQADDMVMAMRSMAENAIPMPNIPEMDVMWTVAGNLLTDVNMSGKDVQQSADQAQKKALELIENMR